MSRIAFYYIIVAAFAIRRYVFYGRFFALESFQKLKMKPFSLLSGPDGFLQRLIGSKVIPLLLECYIGFPAFCGLYAHARKPAGIVAAQLSLQCFHAGSIDEMPGTLRLLHVHRAAVTAAAYDAAMKQAVLRVFAFPPAIAPASPNHAALLAPSARGCQYGQPSNPHPCQIRKMPTDPMSAVTAAYAVSGAQIVRRHKDGFPAGTQALPCASFTLSLRRKRNDFHLSKDLASQIVNPSRFLLVCHRAPHALQQPGCAHKYPLGFFYTGTAFVEKEILQRIIPRM